MFSCKNNILTLQVYKVVKGDISARECAASAAGSARGLYQEFSGRQALQIRPSLLEGLDTICKSSMKDYALSSRS